MTRDTSPKRQAKRPDNFFHLGCTLSNQWTLCYLAIVLECDTPILEAVCCCAFGHCLLAEDQKEPFFDFMFNWRPIGMRPVDCHSQTAPNAKVFVSYQSGGWRVDVCLRNNKYPLLEVYFPIGNRWDLIDARPLVYGKAEETITRVLRKCFPHFKSKHLIIQ